MNPNNPNFHLPHFHPSTAQAHEDHDDDEDPGVDPEDEAPEALPEAPAVSASPLLGPTPEPGEFEAPAQTLGVELVQLSELS